VSALFRGVSRSGSTISGGLFTGLRRDAAASFSFLIAIPVTAGAALLKGLPLIKLLLVRLHMLPVARGPSPAEVAEMLGGYSPLVLILGAATSFAVGLISLRWLLRIITQRGLNGFVYYCLAAATLTFAWQGYEFFAAR
jgi:undecaprenyl-diphosphatase